MTKTPIDISAVADARMRKGLQALESGDNATAIAELEEASRLDPSNPNILHNLGCALFQDNRMAEAEKILLTSVQLTNNPVTWTLLGDIRERSGRPAEAFQFYKRALNADPKNYHALIQLGAVKETMGDKPGACDCYRLALEARPGDVHATHKYASIVFEKKPEEAVRVWQAVAAAAGENLDVRASALEQLICYKEWSERIKRGEMPYHAARLDELFFNYALPELEELDALNRKRLEAAPTIPAVQISAAMSRFCLKDRHGAERLFRMIGGKIDNQILGTTRFELSFYDELRGFADEDLVRTLPPLIEVMPMVPNGAGILYLSCNFTYFRAFAMPMVVSLRQRSVHTPVHVHIMDANEEETAFALAILQKLAPLKFALTVERPGLQSAPAMEARSYYHAVRFIRFYQHLTHYGVPLWLMDVDAVINTSLDGLFSSLDGKDVAMRIRPGRREPWNQFNACIVGAGTSDLSHKYFKLTAAYLAYFYQRKNLRWGIDQLAMYGVFADMEERGEAPSLALLGEREVDYDYRDDGYVWCNSGAGKFKHLQRLSNPGSLPLANFEDNKFVGVFEQHWNECERMVNELQRRQP